MSSFIKELEELINKHSQENGSDTPDFILAAYLKDSLAAFNNATNWRKQWYSPEGCTYDDQGNLVIKN